MNTLGRLTLKQLRSFAAVYRHGKLSAAAGELGVSDSAVSVAIRQIELALDIRLFDRTTRSLEPTRAASEIIGLAERILRDLEALGTSAKEITSGARGRIHLASPPTIAAALLPGVVRRFSREYENIQILLNDCAPNQLLTLIEAEQVEFGIGPTSPEGATFESIPVLVDEFCVVCAADHSFAERKNLSWVDIAGEPIIAFRSGYGVRQMIDRTATRAGVELNVAHEADFVSTMIWMAVAGLGVSVLPLALTRQYMREQIAVVTLGDPVLKRTISLITKRGRSLSPACELFANMLLEEVGDGKG